MSIRESQLIVEGIGVVQVCVSLPAIIEKNIIINFSAQSGTGRDFSVS